MTRLRDYNDVTTSGENLVPDATPNLMTIVAQALAILDVGARAAYLDRVCGDDALRRQVEELLANDIGSGPVASERTSALNATTPSPLDVTGEHISHSRPDSAATGAHHSSERPDSSALGRVIAGRYTLVQEIGEGGMGSVYLASQTDPVKRQVALKLIKIGMDSKGVLARFDAERQALALMDHPNIARIYDGGVTGSGQPFFVMELVKGVPLTEYCDTQRLSVDARLKLFVSVCQAVQHAHQKGIIHRDLKPGNVLVTEVDGRPTPKVIDFGVAKATEQKLTDLSFSDAGAIVGTPAYMSPEQADPTSMDIDTRSDVYALGVILYEMLTGSPPIDSRQFKRGAILEMLRMVREVEPPRPSTKLSTADALPNIAANRNIEPAKLAKLLRGELDWVAMKALEKDRTRRYETANGLARDIERYLADEVVEARPPSTRYRLRKFVRRNRGQVVAAILVLLTLLTGIAGTTWGMIRADTARLAEVQRVAERDDALGKRDQALAEVTNAVGIADDRAAKLKYQLGVSDMVLATAAYENRDAKLALERLDRVPEIQRGWEWHFLKRRAIGGVFTLKGHADRLLAVSYSADGRKIVTVGRDNTAKSWDAHTGQLILDQKGHAGALASAAINPDEFRIVTGGEKSVTIWDARTGQRLHNLAGHQARVNHVCFSPDGKRFATSGSRDGTVKVWDTRTGDLLLDLKGYFILVKTVSFSPDGRFIAAVSLGDVRVSDSRTGQTIAVLAVRNLVMNAAFSADGSRIATVSEDGSAKVWDVGTGAVLVDLKGHTGPVTGVACSPDGALVATAGDDRTVRVWDARSGNTVAELIGHTAPVDTVAFSRDSLHIVSGSSDRTAKVWDARTGTPVVTMEAAGNATKMRLSPDGTRIVAGNFDKTAKVWNARTGTLLLTLPGHTDTVNSGVLSADGMLIATGSDDKTVKLWDARTGLVRRDLVGHTDRVSDVAFTPDGKLLVSASYDKTAKVWDVESGAIVCELKGHTDIVTSVAFNADGTRVVTGSVDQTPRVWDARTGALLQELRGHRNWVWGVSFSADGKRIATACSDGTARVWDAESWAVLSELKGHTGPVGRVAFSPDGTRVATGSFDKSVRVWDVRTGTTLVTLNEHSNQITSVSFSRDGTRLVTCGQDAIKVLDAKVGVGVPEETSESVQEVADHRFHTQPDARRYFDRYNAARQANDRFAASFFLDRLLSLPQLRTIAWFQERNTFQADTLVIARTSFHHPALAKAPYDQGIVAYRAVNGDRLAQRLVAQELLRSGKPGRAVPLLFACLLSRSDASPPVEELLLARAYLDLKLPGEAKRFYRAATEWLDHPGQPVRAANLVASCALSPWVGLVTTVAPVADPRRNPFDWEAWHECDVFRAEVERRAKGGP